MFANRIRNAALALAGAALIATSLMSSVAVAAPADSLPLPASAETVAVQPVVNLPRADADVSLSKIELSGLPKYTYTVANHGPEAAGFKVKIVASYRNCSGCDIQQDRIEETVTFNPNTSKEYHVECKADMVLHCLNVYGEAKVVGLDPYSNNNIDYVVH
jgi:hypothetical protein